MKILVTAATEMEIKKFKEQHTKPDILITGVGVPSCIYALTKHLQQNKYDFIIQAGIAGAFKNTVALGETVVVQKDVFADLGVQEKAHFFTLFEKDFMDKHKMPYTDGMLVNSVLPDIGLPVVNAITVNMVTDDPLLTIIFYNKFKPHIETMEGAAFHYVCLQEGIPFLQIRSISNVVGERNKANWNMKASLENLNENLIRIVKDL